MTCNNNKLCQHLKLNLNCLFTVLHTEVQVSDLCTLNKCVYSIVHELPITVIPKKNPALFDTESLFNTSVLRSTFQIKLIKD